MLVKHLKIYTYIVSSCIEISNLVGRTDNCLAKAQQLSILLTLLRYF